MKTKSTKKAKTSRDSKEFYSFKNYVPNKNAVPVTYNGKTYLSKAQCMALEGITRKELDAYLNSQKETVVKSEVEIPKQVAIEENLDEQTEELVQDIPAEQNETSLDDFLND